MMDQNEISPKYEGQTKRFFIWIRRRIIHGHYKMIMPPYDHIYTGFPYWNGSIPLTAQYYQAPSIPLHCNLVGYVNLQAWLVMITISHGSKNRKCLCDAIIYYYLFLVLILLANTLPAGTPLHIIYLYFVKPVLQKIKLMKGRPL